MGNPERAWIAGVLKAGRGETGDRSGLNSNVCQILGYFFLIVEFFPQITAEKFAALLVGRLSLILYL